MEKIRRLLPRVGACLGVVMYVGASSGAGLNVANDPVVFGGLPNAAIEDDPVCFDQATGQLGQCDNPGGLYPNNIIWVAKSGGDYTDLRTALSDITDASSSNLYLIRIAPGEYDLGTSPLQLKPYVNIEGSGINVTTVLGSVGAGGSVWTGMLLGANHSVIKDLSLENNCNHALCAAMFNSGVSPNLSRVKIVVTNQAGNVTNGVHNAYSASPTFRNTIIEVSSSTGASQGIYSYSNCEVAIVRSRITVEGLGSNEGVHSHAATSFIEHSTIKANTATVVTNNYVAFPPAAARVYASRLAGGAVAASNGAPAPSCAGVTDEDNTFYSNTCP